MGQADGSKRDVAPVSIGAGGGETEFTGGQVGGCERGRWVDLGRYEEGAPLSNVMYQETKRAKGGEEQAEEVRHGSHQGDFVSVSP